MNLMKAAGMMTDNLPSLVVYLSDEVIFQSHGKWLYPLFDFEVFLQQLPQNLRNVRVHDKVIGKAAALLLVRLRVGSVHAALISTLARQVFETWMIPYTFDNQVARIDCQTEAILLDIDDIDQAYQILCQRAQRC
jgi:hypothetical protein